MWLKHNKGVDVVSNNRNVKQTKEVLKELNEQNKKYVLAVAQALAFTQEDNNNKQSGEEQK